MEHGTVRDIDAGTEHAGVLRDNQTVAFVVGKLTRYVALEDFAELGLKWKPLSTRGDMVPPECRREPIDSPQFFRT
ncbi:hypothetical protein ACFSHT_22260 [Paraburkholderia silviterrae]|uniref:Uncharacterized protein n=1 Tax=Paraburkholderia silviterrae TaxID=2528715 RepID=A0A4R5MF72_9BURK|nr:hypothetical protein [Paraburkholderia silviterrae]TDG25893.1 hypothetical protein EYW47_00540 [Paraburkholderia silviterrae]